MKRRAGNTEPQPKHQIPNLNHCARHPSAPVLGTPVPCPPSSPPQPLAPRSRSRRGCRPEPTMPSPPGAGLSLKWGTGGGPRSWTLNGSATARALGTPGPNRARQLPCGNLLQVPALFGQTQGCPDTLSDAPVARLLPRETFLLTDWGRHRRQQPEEYSVRTLPYARLVIDKSKLDL